MVTLYFFSGPRNAKMTIVPECWLFDDHVKGHTEERAQEIRQLIAVKNYLDSLQISADRITTFLLGNRQVLGAELVKCLQLIMKVTAKKPTGISNLRKLFFFK